MKKKEIKAFFPTVEAYMKYVFQKNKTLLSVFLFLSVVRGILPVISPYFFSRVIAAFERSPRELLFENTKTIVIAYIVFSCVSPMLMQISGYVRRVKVLPKLMADGITDAFSYVRKQDYFFFTNNFAGALSNKINDIANGARDLVWGSGEIFATFCGFCIALTFFFKINTTIAAIALVWLVFQTTYTLVNIKKWNRNSFIAGTAKSTAVGKIVDTLTNYVNVKLFARGQYEEEYNKKSIRDFFKKRKRSSKILQRDMNILVAVVTMVEIAIVLLMIRDYSLGAAKISDIFFVVFGFSVMSDAVFSLNYLLAEFAENYGQTKQALSIISKPIGMPDMEDAAEMKVTKGVIEFKGVSFNYPGTEKSVLKKVDLKIEKNEKVGIVGYSGAGKSTFIHLLLRYFDVTEGAILIDHQDVRTVTQDSLHESIAMIPQDTSLFHRTIMENTRYGKLEASDADVIAAAKKAHAHDFIMNLPEKYDSMVGERGVKLSVGQRQRIAIARAILKDAPILILDEATSALDSETEILIQDSLKDLMRKKTSIVVAHRLSTLREMDRILVFDKGKIVEEGSHAALVRNKKGLYARLWAMQSGGFLPTAFDNINKPEEN